jgi:hypothetical protein
MSPCLTKHHTMKAYGEVEYIYIHVFFTSPVLGGEWSSSTQWKIAQFPVDWRSGGPQTRPGRYGEVNAKWRWSARVGLETNWNTTGQGKVGRFCCDCHYLSGVVTTDYCEGSGKITLESGDGVTEQRRERRSEGEDCLNCAWLSEHRVLWG